MNYASILTDPSSLKQLENVCWRRFGEAPEADECYLFILDRCQEADCRRLRSFSGKSSIKTYLYTLFNNLAVDFKRSKYGRKRIPKLISTMGSWAESIYKLVCWQRYSYEDAWEIVTLDNVYTKSFNQFLNDIEELGKAPCKENPYFFSTTNDNDEQEDLADQKLSNNPLESLINKLDREKRIKAARVIRVHTTDLPAEDQLIVRLIYGDNHSIAAAGRIVGLGSVQAQRKLKKILTSFRLVLLKEGITGL